MGYSIILWACFYGVDHSLHRVPWLDVRETQQYSVNDRPLIKRALIDVYSSAVNLSLDLRSC